MQRQRKNANVLSYKGSVQQLITLYKIVEEAIENAIDLNIFSSVN